MCQYQLFFVALDYQPLLVYSYWRFKLLIFFLSDPEEYSSLEEGFWKMPVNFLLDHFKIRINT